MFIDTTLHKSNATGITLSNLFGAWPKGRLYMIGDKVAVDRSIKSGYCGTYELKVNNYRHKFPLGFAAQLVRLILSFVKRIKFSDSYNGNLIKKDTSVEARQNKFYDYFFSVFCGLGLDIYFYRQVISAELRKWINDTNPDYFYALLSTRHSILFAQKLVSEFRKPLIIHIMDDWPATIGNKSFFYTFLNRTVNHELKILLQLSHKRIAISELMALEYSKRFGGDWLFFHNPVDVTMWSRKKALKNSGDNNFKILYSGRLSTGVSETIKSVSDAVDNLNVSTGYKVSFQIQSDSRPGWIHNYKNTYFSHFISYDLLPDLFSSVDLLLLPYDFDGRSFDFIRLSMPTKVTEYMASGTPILIVAPPDCALSYLASKSDFAHIVNTPSSSKLRDKLLFILESKELREVYSKNALRLVESSFDIKKVQSLFFEVFESSNES